MSVGVAIVGIPWLATSTYIWGPHDPTAVACAIIGAAHLVWAMAMYVDYLVAGEN